MKQAKNYLLLLFTLLGLSFTACSSDDGNTPEPSPYESYSMTQMDVTLNDQVKRPLFKFTYNNDGQLTRAIHYFYNIGEEEGNPNSVALDETTTYNFTRSENKITVICSLIDHTENDEVREWTTTITTAHGYITQVENIDNEGETVHYTWDSGKLKKLYDYDFTYNGNNVKEVIEKSTDTYGEYIYDESCTYVLDCNTGKWNAFSCIPMELLAVMDGEDIDMLSTILCANEVKQVVHTDKYITKNKSDNKLISESLDRETTDYTYVYNNSNLISKANAKYTYYRKVTDYQNAENNQEKTEDRGTTIIDFTYEKN